MPELKQIDADYAFLSERLGAAEKMLEEVTNSSKNYAVTRAYGGEAGSIGGNLPAGSRGWVNTALDQVQPDRAARAREAYGLLMTPGSTLPAHARPGMMARVTGLLDSMVGPMAGWGAGHWTSNVELNGST